MQCPRCEGSGSCQECKGQGQVACLTCQGTGQRSSSRGGSYPCRSCQGSGQLSCSPSCASCEGSGQITETLQRRHLDKYRVSFDNTLPLSRITQILIVCSLLVYSLGLFYPSADVWMKLRLSNMSGLWTQEPWRLLTYAFLHGGLIHLVLNMSALFRYGAWVEGFYGSRRFLLIVTLSAITAGLASSYIHLTLDDPIRSLGASGYLFGLFGVLAGAHVRYRVFQGKEITELLTSIAIFTAVAISWSGLGIDHWAHLGGFLGGFAYAWGSRRPSGH